MGFVLQRCIIKLCFVPEIINLTDIMPLGFNGDKHLIVVCGPTAVGKTALVIQLALRLKTEIISTDSRQFYNELNAATGKPDKAELAMVRHHFINCRSIKEAYSAGAYEADALALLSELYKVRDVVIAVGGSGLYFKALSEGLDHFPVISQELRKALNDQAGTVHGLNLLIEELKDKDPAYYEQVDRMNPRRIIRALEVIRSSGKPYTDFKTESAQKRDFKIHYIRLQLPREELYKKINLRVEGFVDSGLLDEVKSLMKFRNFEALQTPGYREMFEFLDGDCSLDYAIDKIKQHNRNYAKRQETWLNKMVPEPKFHPMEFENIIQYLLGRGLIIE
jgi:tRNA dimethylallyltransferase